MSGSRRAVLPIDVDDDKFKNFLALYDKYTASLAKLPGGWSAVTKETDGLSKRIGEMTAAMLAQQEMLNKGRDAQNKAANQAEREAKAWHGMAQDAKSFSASIHQATLSLLKWTSLTGVVGGLLGAGGLYGLDRLAASVGSQRRAALGLGVTTGEKEAFRVNYGRFIDSDSALGNVAGARSDYSRRWAFSALGLRPDQIEQLGTAQLTQEVTQRARQAYMKSDRSQQQAQALGLTEFFSMEELRRLGNSPDSEFSAAGRGYERDKTALSLSPDVAAKWQNFTAQLERAGTTLENTFAKGLVGLEKPLEDLSKSLTKAAETLLSSPKLKEWIESLGRGIEHLATYLTSDQFQEDMTSFVDDIDRLAKAIGHAYHWLMDHLPDSWTGGETGGTPADPTKSKDYSAPGDTDAQGNKIGGDGPLEPGLKGMSQFPVSERQKAAAQLLLKGGWSPTATAGILGYISEETGGSFDPNSYNPLGGGNGARGLFQMRADQIKAFRLKYGHDILDPNVSATQRFREQIEFFNWYTSQGQPENLARHFIEAAKSPEEAAKETVRTYGRPGDDTERAITKAQKATREMGVGRVLVEINNNTGGNAIVSTSQLPQ